MGKPMYNCEYLPREIVVIIRKVTEKDRDYRTINNYIKVVGAIYLHQMMDDSSYMHYSPLSREYWRTVIGSHYSKYVNRLLKEKVIEKKENVKYLSDFGDVSRVTGYRINPEFLNDDLRIIKYAGLKSESESADMADGRVVGNTPNYKIGFDPELIRLQKGQALKWIETNISTVVSGYLNSEYISGVPKSLPVLVRIYYNNDGFSASYMSVEAAEKFADENGKKLLYYKDKFVIADEEQFIRIANQNLSTNYKWHVKSFLPDSFNFSRNNNTLRVYSKLSSLPSALLPFIRINGQYILQADLKCSQFALFANLLNYYLSHSDKELIALFKKQQAKRFVTELASIFNKHKDKLPEEGLDVNKPTENDYIANDAYQFMVDTLMHDFYSIIKSELSLPQRSHGKSIAFRTVFSKPKPENELVRQFRQLYPTIIGIINDYKTKFGYNQFAIGLQRIEAEIFIDHIWKQAKKQRINSFTRHDSIIFPINKKKEVEAIITDVFKSFGFIYRIEYEEFNYDEIMQRLINETDYIDYTDDFDEAFLYSMLQPVKSRKINRLVLDSEQLQEITLPKHKKRDYFNHVSQDTLWQLYELDGLTLELQQALEEDIANLQSNYPIPQFQIGTNRLISRLIDIMN